MSELLSIRELAAYLGVAEKTIYQWRYRGEGPMGFRVGGQIRYRPEDVETWLQRQADQRPPAA